MAIQVYKLIPPNDDFSHANINGRDYFPERAADGSLYIELVHVEDIPILKRAGFRDPKDPLPADAARAALPDPNLPFDPATATVEQLTDFLEDAGIPVPSWRDILAANVGQVIAARLAGEQGPATLKDPEPASPPPPPPPTPPQSAQDGSGPASTDSGPFVPETAKWVELRSFLDAEAVVYPGNASTDALRALARSTLDAKA